MTNKELKKLTRAELLELLLAQTRETEQLKERLYDVQMKLADRQLRISEAGDLAQASLMINGVMDAAQAAARQYLENIAAMERETKAACERMTVETRDECAQMRAATKAECDRMLSEARTEAANIRRKAREGRRKAKKAAETEANKSK